MVAQAFQPARLRLARTLRGWQQNELAIRVALSPAAISQYEAGDAQPTSEVLERLALVLKCRPEFLFRPLRFREPQTAFFRSLRSTPKMQRDRARSYALVLAEIAAALDEYVELPRVDIPQHLHLAEIATETDVELRVQTLRESLCIEAGPVPNVVRLLEAHGVIVAAVGDFDGRLDAFSLWAGSRPVCILCSAKGVPKRRRFDSAHELGHLVLHEQAEPGAKWQERQAHRFASALLMPAGEVEPWLPRRPNQLEVLQEASVIWGVSMQALLYRARELGTLSEANYTRTMRRFAALGWRTAEPVEEGPEEAPVLLGAALDSLRAGGGTIEGLSERVGMPRGRLCRMLAVPEDRAEEPDGELVRLADAAG